MTRESRFLFSRQSGVRPMADAEIGRAVMRFQFADSASAIDRTAASNRLRQGIEHRQ